MTDQKNTKNDLSPKPKIEIDQEDKLVFPTLSNAIITSSDSLCKILRQLFDDVFSDFAGLNVEFNPNNDRFTIVAYFYQTNGNTGNKDKPYRCFVKDAYDQNGNNIHGYERFDRFRRITDNGQRYIITDDAKSILEPFMHRDACDNKGNVLWNSRNVGIITNTNKQRVDFYSRNESYSVIHLIDPIKLIQELYGRKANIYIGNDETNNPIIEKRELGYQIIVNRSIGTNNTPMSNYNRGPYQITIYQVDFERVKEESKNIGFYFSYGPNII